MFDLRNKTIIVVGGSSGIGLSVATHAFKLGASVTLTGTTLSKAIQAAQGIGETVQAAALDVNDETAVNNFIGGFAAIDHLYLAAGSTKLVSVTDGILEESMQYFDTKLLGNLKIVRAAAAKINTGGSFTFTGGISTDRPIKGAWVSGLATASCEQLARVLVMEFSGIRFNAVSPGYTDTPMWDAVMGENKAGILATVAASLPVKKIATPDEVAMAVIFLMCNASVTGETIHVDGGGRLI